MNKDTNNQKHKLEDLKHDLEVKKSRIDKGWVRDGEQFTNPITGEPSPLSKENIDHAINDCDTTLLTYAQARKTKRNPAVVAVNIVAVLLLLGAIVASGWYYIGPEGVTGFVTSELSKATGYFSDSSDTPSTLDSATEGSAIDSGDDITNDDSKEAAKADAESSIPTSDEKNIRSDNHPPEFSGLESLSIEGELVLDMYQYVHDTDLDALTFIASQPEGTVVSVEGNIISITGLRSGEGMITLIASDDLELVKHVVPITFKPAQ